MVLLEVAIEGVGRMRPQSVGLEARLPRLQRLTVRATRPTGEVQRSLQLVLAHSGLRQAVSSIASFGLRGRARASIRRLLAGGEIQFVHMLHVRIEQPIIPLRRRPWLLILVEQSEEVRLDGEIGLQRCACAGHDVLHQIAIVQGRILNAGSELVLVSHSRPPGLGHDDRQILKLHIQCHHR